MEKLFPMERRLAKVVRPVLSRVTSLPLPGDDAVTMDEDGGVVVIPVMLNDYLAEEPYCVYQPRAMMEVRA